jgi:signal transduction histidine kinase
MDQARVLIRVISHGRWFHDHGRVTLDVRYGGLGASVFAHDGRGRLDGVGAVSRRPHVGVLRARTSEQAGSAFADAQQRFRHDLRQPLVTTTLLLEGVASLPALEPVAAERVREAQRQIAWALELLRAQEDDDERAEVVEIGAAVADHVASAAIGCDTRLRRRGPAHALVDPVGLVRATRNLLDNAARAVSGHGTVEVCVDRWRGQAVLGVADSGPGFGHVEPRHGYGLVYVRGFAERWGGTVTFGGSRLGGAQVTLRLPLAVPRSVGRVSPS